MKKEQIAINSVSTRGADLPETLAAYSEAGFSKVEFALRQVKQFLATGHRVADLRQRLDDIGLACIGGFECTVCCFGVAAQRAENHRLLMGNAELIAELGGSVMVVGTDGPAKGSGDSDPIETIASAFSGLGATVGAFGVTLCIEFNWSPIVKSMRTAAEIAARSQSPHVGVLFDPAHYHCTPTKFDQLSSENVDWVRHVHVNDMRDKPAELSNCNSDRVLPGEGCLDLRALFGQLELLGYEGCFSIEMFNEDLWAMPVGKASKLMYESLLSLCDGV